jgi:hypothetical protein
VGGNWLRFSKLGATEAEVEEAEPGLARQVDVAARLADSHGDDAAAIATLGRAIDRFPDAPPLERARALLYRADLAVRLGREELAAASLAEAQAIPLDDADREAIAAEASHVEALLG